MNFNFSAYPLQNRGYSDRPMTLLDPAPKALLTGIMEVSLIETGNRSAREQWQQTQLRNLLNHAAQRSSFWKKRIGGRTLSDVEIASLPILNRQELRNQVAAEGPLLRPTDKMPTRVRTTSGSSGLPVRFFVSEFNGRYNSIRSIAQYFMEGRDLSLNRTRVIETPLLKDGISVETRQTWIGSLGYFIKSGASRRIVFSSFATNRENCYKLVEELRKEQIGYLSCSPRHIDMISSATDLGFLRTSGIAMWIPFGEHLNPRLTEVFSELSIPIRGNYSAEEVGMIGAECPEFSGYYHVATSNVIVEVIDQSYDIEGIRVGRVLITHLHSYATPFIRYDVGDLACLARTCPCGHNGPAIYNLQGRFNRILKHRDGRVSPFYVTATDLADLAHFTEYRIRQTAFEQILIELGGRSELNRDEISAITTFLKQRAGEEFRVEVKPCAQIDWGESRKKPGFRCEI